MIELEDVFSNFEKIENTIRKNGLIIKEKKNKMFIS